MSLRNRIGRLEVRYGGECRACGQSDKLPGNGPIEVLWADPDEPEGEAERCSLCGKPTLVVIRWRDIAG